MKMTGILTVAAVMLAVGLGAFDADARGADLKKVWGGGKQESSTYSGKYVPHIIGVLDENRLAGYEWGGISEGTVMNAELITKNPTHLAVGQLDILRDLAGKPLSDGSGNYAFTILHENVGPECLYAVTAQKGYSTWGHVLGNAWDLTVYTGGPKSGSYGTLEGLMEIYPDLNDALVEHAGGIDDILKAVQAKPASMGFFVMRPDPESKVWKTIDDAGLTLVPVVDFDLEGLYEFKSLKVAHGGLLWGEASYHETACTSVALITGDPNTVSADDTRTLRRLNATIKRIGSIDPDTLKPSLASWRDMWDSMKGIASNRLTELMEASKKALDDAARNFAE